MNTPIQYYATFNFHILVYFRKSLPTFTHQILTDENPYFMDCAQQ